MWCSKTNKRDAVGRILKKNILFLLLFFIAAAGAFAKGNVDSETAKAYFEIAQAYTEVSKYDKATEFYLKAAKDPAHKNAAEYIEALRKKAQAGERQYKEAPENVLIAKAYAYSLAATGNEARACEMYKKLYDEDSENPEAALNYARILMIAKQYDEALSFIKDLKTRLTESADNKALAELEEKIKKAQEEPEKQEKEGQNKDDKTQNKDDTVPDAVK